MKKKDPTGNIVIVQHLDWFVKSFFLFFPGHDYLVGHTPQPIWPKESEATKANT
jgi:hypothetical protein